MPFSHKKSNKILEKKQAVSQNRLFLFFIYTLPFLLLKITTLPYTSQKSAYFAENALVSMLFPFSLACFLRIFLR